MLVALGIAGSIASVIGLLIAAPTRRSRIVHLAYAIFITALAGGMVSYQQQAIEAERRIAEMQKIEREAAKLLSGYDFTTSGSMSGFMLASLSFLEKYKTELPDTYARAASLCENAGCLKTSNGEYSSSMEHFRNLQDASSAMHYLIQGIAKSEG
jgi:hypothetical protein